MRRVVITGIGIYSSIGRNKSVVTKSLHDGFCGIIRDDHRLECGFRSPLTGGLLPPSIPYSVTRFMSLGTEYTYMAAKEAISDFKGDYSKCGVIIGNDSNAGSMAEAIEERNKLQKNSKLGPTHVIKTMTSNPSALLSSSFGFGGISLTIGGACASGGHAVGISYSLIKQGIEDMILCGGCQEVNEESVFAFDALKNFSVSESPSEAVRPFDEGRSGLVPSGGAACLILEELQHAIDRGATIYGEVVGYGATSSGKLVVSDLDSQIECMRRALENINPDEVDFISAHATGTITGDECEAEAIRKIFHNNPYISATKALTGHEMWMAGASEIVYSLLAIHDGFVPPNPNTQDYSLGLNIRNNRVELEKCDYMLSNSFGLGGTNSSILIKTNYARKIDT